MKKSLQTCKESDILTKKKTNFRRKFKRNCWKLTGEMTGVNDLEFRFTITSKRMKKRIK